MLIRPQMLLKQWAQRRWLCSKLYCPRARNWEKCRVHTLMWVANGLELSENHYTFNYECLCCFVLTDVTELSNWEIVQGFWCCLGGTIQWFCHCTWWFRATVGNDSNVHTIQNFALLRMKCEHQHFSDLFHKIQNSWRDHCIECSYDQNHPRFIMWCSTNSAPHHALGCKLQNPNQKSQLQFDHNLTSPTRNAVANKEAPTRINSIFFNQEDQIQHQVPS